MKKTFHAILALCLLTTIVVAGPRITANATQRFAIDGMSCGGCAAGLQFELEEARGVVKAEVVFDRKLAVVSYDTNVITFAGVTNVIKKAGFKSRLLTVTKPR